MHVQSHSISPFSDYHNGVVFVQKPVFKTAILFVGGRYSLIEREKDFVDISLFCLDPYDQMDRLLSVGDGMHENLALSKSSAILSKKK